MRTWFGCLDELPKMVCEVGFMRIRQIDCSFGFASTDWNGPQVRTQTD